VNRAGEEFNGLNRGLAAEIGARLSELKELHSSKDTPRRPAVEPPGKAAVEVARGAGLVAPPIVRFDSGSTLSLAETTGEKSSMKIYGVELPLGSLIRLFHGLFMPSTRLSSSVHWHGECLIIIAGIDSEGLIWRAQQELRPGATSEQRASAFAAAREEIVYHIFTDLSSIESSEWVAVQEFSEGLLAYRRTLNSDMNKVLNLHKAEEHFFKAISADKNFSRCRYNLGVVYRELEASYGHAQSKHTRGYRQAAIASFMQTLDDNPKDVDAAYALAIICREKRENYAKSIEFAERAIAQMPTHVRMAGSLLRGGKRAGRSVRNGECRNRCAFYESCDCFRQTWAAYPIKKSPSPGSL
jgi:hypothetical protein